MEIVVIILAIIGMIIQGTFIVVEHKEKYVLAVILKGSASLIFITIGILAIIKGCQSNLLLIGLILGGIGDILLNLRFVFKELGSKIFLAGVASFLAGHILYLIAIINNNTPWLYSLIAGIVVAAIILTIIFKVLTVKLSYKIFGILYLGAVSLMVAMSIGNVIVAYDSFTLTYAIGAILFMVSDIVLIFNSFSSNPRFSFRITNLSLYYLGQLLIGISMFMLIK